MIVIKILLSKLYQKSMNISRQPSKKTVSKYKIKDYLQISIIGVLGTFLYNLFLYLGIDTLEASQPFHF